MSEYSHQNISGKILTQGERMRFKIFFILIVSLISTNLSGAFLFDKEIGRQQFAFCARSLAMGSTSIASNQGILNGINNPATISLLSKNFGIEISTNITKNDEDRSFPTYNFFDSYVDNSVYVSNADFFDKYFGGIYGQYEIPLLKFTMALSYTPLYDFNAKYEEEVRNDENSNNDNEPKKIAINSYNTDGMIYSYNFNWALKFNLDNDIIPFVSFGTTVSKIKGNVDREKKIIFTDVARKMIGEDADELKDSLEIFNTEYSGTNFQIGTLLEIGKRIKFGVNYSPKISLDVDWKNVINDSTINGSREIDYPSQIGFGIEYHPRNLMDTRFNLDIRFINWTDLTEQFDDIVNYYAGVEHIMYNKIPLRLGFSYCTSGINKEIALMSFSGGTAIRLPHNIILDFGAEIGNFEYETPDMFPDSYYNYPQLWDNLTPQNRTVENPDTVTNFFINTFATLSFSF